MEENEMLETSNDTENVETQATEEIEEGIELTDTTDTTESDDVGDATSNEETVEEETKEVKKSLRELLRDNPEYQEEYNNMLKIRLDREDRKHQRELSKYRDTDNVLRTTLNIKDGDDTNTKLREYYEAEGVKLPERIQNDFNNEDLEDLGTRDAEKILSVGLDYAEEEANRLARIGYENLNVRERASFNKLADELTKEKKRKELLSLGAKEELLNNKDFKDFTNQFNSNVSMEKIYDLYTKIQPKKKVELPGSMKSNNTTSALKDFYTYDEAKKFTDEDYSKYPELESIVEKSMQKW